MVYGNNVRTRNIGISPEKKWNSGSKHDCGATCSTSFHTFHTFLQIPMGKLPNLSTSEMIQLPVLLVEGGISPGLVGRLSWQRYAAAKNHRNLIILLLANKSNMRSRTQGWRSGLEKSTWKRRNKQRCITKRQTKLTPFPQHFHMKSACSHVAQYLREGLWIVIDTPFKFNRSGHAPAESQRSCPMLVLAAWACVGPVTSVNLRLFFGKKWPTGYCKQQTFF